MTDFFPSVLVYKPAWCLRKKKAQEEAYERWNNFALIRVTLVRALMAFFFRIDIP